jgi:hypothetical protein
LTVQHPLNVTTSFNLNEYSVMINVAKKNRAARERAGMKPVSKHIATVDIVTHVLRSSGHKPCPSRSEYDLLLEKIASLRGFLEDCAAHEREVLDSINWNHRRS